MERHKCLHNLNMQAYSTLHNLNMQAYSTSHNLYKLGPGRKSAVRHIKELDNYDPMAYNWTKYQNVGLEKIKN